MSWKKVKLGDFLTNRENRFKPNDKAIIGLKRIEKIDFSGEIFLSDKPSNTDMILIKKGDLVISGINVEKGAMAVYTGNEDITATIHYSSYNFDENKIDIEFLKHFLKSSEFKEALKEQVPGGIKTEIKPKHLLPLIVEIPTDINDQKKVVSKLKKQNSKIENIDTELTHQLDLVKQLRQAFLREAMQGRLVSQNPADGSAADLLRQIKFEKQKLIADKKLKKEKELPPIKPEEIPFDIPDNWVWCRLDNVSLRIHYGFNASAKLDKQEVRLLRITDIQDNKVDWNSVPGCDFSKSDLENYLLQENDIVIARTGGTIGKTFIVKNIPVKSLFASYLIRVIPSQNILAEFLKYFMESPIYWKQLYDAAWGAGQPNVNGTSLSLLRLPLPPLSEQERIVEKLEELMGLCDELEQSIRQSRDQSDMLLRQVLRGALQGEVVDPVERVAATLKPLPISENRKHFAKQVLGGKIVSAFRDDKHFTHIKFQKLQYLAEHLAQADLSLNYYRQAAGPYDPKFMHTVISKLEASKWFEEVNYKFKPLEKAQDIDKYYNNYFALAKDKLDKLFGYFHNATEEQCEIVATVYAVWNDMLIRREQFDEEKIISTFFEWSDRKKKYEENQVKSAIKWMREHELEPVGFGSLIKVAKGKSQK